MVFLAKKIFLIFSGFEKRHFYSLEHIIQSDLVLYIIESIGLLLIRFILTYLRLITIFLVLLITSNIITIKIIVPKNNAATINL